MQDLADRALNVAQLGGAHDANVRVVESRSLLVEVRNRRAEAFGHDAEPTLFDDVGNPVAARALEVSDAHFTAGTRS